MIKKMEVTRFLLLVGVCIVGCPLFAFSQKVISGTVANSNNELQQGVTVKLKQAAANTTTGKAGQYSINIKTQVKDTLVFSHVGFHTKEVPLLANKFVYDVVLQTAENELDNVIIIGYGTTTKKDITGSVGQASIADMKKAPVASFTEALAGRVAGVQVNSNDGQPGSELNIVVRGNNSVTQANSPLYVVDGFPIETAVGNLINQEEIASIEVLKDASATAIYGARGANGVVIITTKKGNSGAPTVTYNGWVGVQQVIKKMEMMDPYEFVKYQLEQSPTVYTPVYLKDGRTLEDYRNVKGIDWQDLVLRDALMQNHSLALRGGNDKTKYAVSGSYLNQDGVILNSGFSRYQGRVVLDQVINKKIKAGININYTGTKKYGATPGESLTSPTSSVMYSVWGYRPVTGDPSADASLPDELYDPNVDPAAGTDFRINPLLAIQNEYNPLFTNNLFTNAYIEYKILKNLTIRSSGGFTRINRRSEIFNNSKSRNGHPFTNNKVNGSITNTEITNLLNENTITYAPQFKGGHSFKILAGFTMQDIRQTTNGFTSILIPTENLGIKGLDNGQITTAPVTDQSNGLLSYLGRVDYSFKSKYLLTASFRADGSSKFPKSNRWAFFPSGAIAWRFKEEGFAKKLDFLDDGKIRAGIGATGNNRVSDYASLSSLEIGPATGYSTGNIPGPGMVPTNLGNPGLKWETTVQTDIGLDLSFFKKRINFTADYYYKVTRDLLINATLAPSTGFLSAYKNVGKVSNRGIEFTLDTRNIVGKNFSWTTSFNISFNANKVIALNDGQPSLPTRITWGNFNNAYPYIAIPDHPIALFYGFLFDGIYQFSDFDQPSAGTYVLKPGVPNNGNQRANIRPGDIRFKDINGDGEVNNFDLTIIGNPNPKHIGGINNNFEYKNFDLNVFFQWSYGNDLLNANRIEFENGEPIVRWYLNMFKSYADRWTPDNPSNTLYRVGGQGPAVYSSRTIEDGSFIRLKTVSLGYNISPRLLSRIKIKSFRVFASAQNLITWTKYTGPDPEVSTRPTALTPGFDWSPYPRPRTMTLGVDVSF